MKTRLTFHQHLRWEEMMGKCSNVIITSWNDGNKKNSFVHFSLFSFNIILMISDLISLDQADVDPAFLHYYFLYLLSVAHPLISLSLSPGVFWVHNIFIREGRKGGIYYLMCGGTRLRLSPLIIFLSLFITRIKCSRLKEYKKAHQAPFALFISDFISLSLPLFSQQV